MMPEQTLAETASSPDLSSDLFLSTLASSNMTRRKSSSFSDLGEFVDVSVWNSTSTPTPTEPKQTPETQIGLSLDDRPVVEQDPSNNNYIHISDTKWHNNLSTSSQSDARDDEVVIVEDIEWSSCFSEAEIEAELGEDLKVMKIMQGIPPVAGEELLQHIDDVAFIIFSKEQTQQDEEKVNEEKLPPAALKDQKLIVDLLNSGFEVVLSDRFLCTSFGSDNDGSSISSSSSNTNTKSLGRGLFRASTSVGAGLLKGAAGLMNQTYEGGAEGGLFGFAKGLGLGMLGFGSHTVKGAFNGMYQVTNVVGEMVLGASPHFSLNGRMLLTNYRLVWLPRNNSNLLLSTKNLIEIPLGLIHSLENVATAPHVLSLQCKTFLLAHFAFDTEETCCQLLGNILALYTDSNQHHVPSYNGPLFPPPPNTLDSSSSSCSSNSSNSSSNCMYAFADVHMVATSTENNVYYDPFADYVRLGLISAKDTKNDELKMLENKRESDGCVSYPDFFLVPSGLTDSELMELSSYRSSRRIPAVVFQHPLSNARMCRASQPSVGLSGRVVSADQKVVALLNKSVFHFVDCRSSIAAVANVVSQGKGTEDIRNYPNTQLHFCDIANIHTVRKYYQQLSSSHVAEDWLTQLGRILISSVLCCQFLSEGESVMVHCSDGWDRTPQLTTLIQLLLDPHYRTVIGIIQLIEKEWVSFGHQFQTRFAATIPPNSQEIDEMSPVFIQWLDCLYQLIVQLPWAFEFNKKLLSFLHFHVFSAKYHTFLHNTQLQQPSAITSIWEDVLISGSTDPKVQFRNDQYDGQRSFATKGTTLPIQTDHLILWDIHIHQNDPIRTLVL